MGNILFALMLAFALLGCEKQPPQTAEPLHKITVAYTYQPQSTLVHVALAKGYFAENNLDVRSEFRTYGKAALQAVLDGTADLATVAETPVMFSVLKGEKINILANIEASNINNGIVARRDAGISVINELRGKRIGYVPGTTADFFLDSMLTANGILRAEIQSVPLKPEEMFDAMMSGKIDAASIWNYPLMQIQMALGDKGVIFYDRQIYTETFNIAAQQAFVKANPEVIKRFLKALIRAEEFVKQNSEEAQDIMVSVTKVDKNLIKAVWHHFGYHVRLDRTLLITLEDETRWAIKNHLAEQTAMPDYLNVIYPDLLREIKPSAIQIN